MYDMQPVLLQQVAVDLMYNADLYGQNTSALSQLTVRRCPDRM